VSNRLQEDSLR